MRKQEQGKMNQTELQRANRRAAWRWGSLIVGLLGLQVAGGVIAILLATGDESVAVVPNYHEKALNWDREIAAQAASAALGWKCDVAPTGAGSLPAGLRIALTNREGNPVQVVSGTLRLYRHARANDVRELPIRPGEFSLVELPGCFEVAGLWQVILELRGDRGERFMHSQEVQVAMMSGPAKGSTQ